MTALALALVIVAGILAVVELVRSRGTALLGWAVLAVALALTIPTLVAL